MSLLIMGHQRSGTSMLRRICHSHPDLAVLAEFGCFMALDVPLRQHTAYILRRWRGRGGNLIDKPFDRTVKSPPKPVGAAQNTRLVGRYLAALLAQGAGPVTASRVGDALQRLYPGAALTGDKNPDYLWLLDSLAALPGLKRVVIVRDPRAVTSSSLRKVRGRWAGHWPAEMQQAGVVAGRWVEQMALLRRHREAVFCLQYEALVDDPPAQMAELAAYLGVDAAGFNTSQVHRNSLTKYHGGLTVDELREVEDVAGEMMAELGYG